MITAVGTIIVNTLSREIRDSKHFSIMSDEAVTKTPVRVTNFSKTNTDDIILDNQTKFTPLSHLPFAYSHTLTANGTVLILSLAHVAAEQLVTVKAEVTHVSGVKKTPTLRQGVVEPFQVPLTEVDPTNKTASITGKIVTVQQSVESGEKKTGRAKVGRAKAGVWAE
ncbi:hypothetical protein P5673_007088, partial [Acropora cervicornis]